MNLNYIVKKYLFSLLLISIACCTKEEKPLQPAQIHYVVGQPYQVGEQWYYPEENFAYHATGLAVISKNQKNKVTADGEYYDPQRMTGAHPTLQLPSIIKVRNVDNGREISIRLNDRPSSYPSRLLELTPKAGELLGISNGQTAKIEIVEDENQSQNLAFEMPNGPQTEMKVNTAPLDTIMVENLNGKSSENNAKKKSDPTFQKALNSSLILKDLPVTFTQGQITGGQIWIDCGSFTLRIYANKLAARIGGRVTYSFEGGRRILHVRSGPYQSVESADQNLDYLLKSGIKGAKIIVE